jgi:iron complex outermembrane receptor protein
MPSSPGRGEARAAAYVTAGVAWAVLLAVGVPPGLPIAAAAAGPPAVVRATAATSSLPEDLLADNLVDLSLEELGDLVVTSALRRNERLSDTPASVYVITSEDIRRSGATTLPQLLRLAPNLTVARADANQWAITARGFNSVLANKMLVLVDGRTVYSPLFSGTFWEVQDILLDEIERIEVVSGPGGASWGTNAVNGVINVVTRSASASEGALVKAGTGNSVDQGGARFGTALQKDLHASVWAKYSEREGSLRGDRSPVGDESILRAGNARLAWAPGKNSVMLETGGYSEDIDQGPTVRDLSGIHALGRWSRPLGETSSLEVQAYYDRTNRDQPGAIDDALDTWDVEIQHTSRPLERHELTWGGSYRYQDDDLVNVNPAALAFIPDDRILRTAGVFAEDGIDLTRVFTIDVAARAESNEYTDWEFLPSIRMSAKPAASHLLWTSLSRAVRAPARVDREFYTPGAPPFALAGGPSFESEVAQVAELGYRGRPCGDFALSLTAFIHEYDDLRSLELGPNGPEWRNGNHGTVRGAEGWLTYEPVSDLRLTAGGVTQRVRLAADEGVTDFGGLALLGNDPPYWFQFGASFDAGTRVELDGQLRKSAPLPQPAVPAYVELNLRAAYWVTRALELSVTGRNLFERSHPEWGVDPVRAEVGRSVFVQMRWRTP